MGNDVFVWIEQFHGQVSPPSWEAIGTARRLSETLGGQVCACLFGDGVEDLAQEAIAYGADRVFLADDPTFSDFRLEPHTALMAHLAEEHEPEVILIGATSRGRDMGPGVAVELESGCVADCTTLDFEDGQLVATRPIYAGKLLCTCVVP
ncbi:MAG: electron transfer flavoprotein subunit alpha, partial [Anaerolineae bacterium]